MNHKTIKRQTKNNFRKINKALKILCVRFDPKDVHAFRVEYKQWRAFLRMLFHQKDRQIIIPRQLKKIYEIAGVIRDLQLQQQRFLDYTSHLPKSSIAYIRLLQNHIHKQERILLKKLGSYNPSVCKKKVMKQLTANLTLERLAGFMEQKAISTKQLVAAGHFSDETLHQIRKQLKDLLFIFKMNDSGQNPALKQSSIYNLDEAQLASLLEQLGNFQDACKSIVLLKVNWIFKLNAYGRRLLLQIKSDWIKEKIFTKQLLIQSLKSAFEENGDSLLKKESSH